MGDSASDVRDENVKLLIVQEAVTKVQENSSKRIGCLGLGA